MMRALILVEHHNGVMNAATSRVLTAAKTWGNEADLLVVGLDVAEVAKEAAMLSGVSRVICVDNACYRDMLAENISSLIVSLAKDYQGIFAAATTVGKDILPRVAALLNVEQVSEVTRIVSADTFEHPIYAGNAIETVRITSQPVVATIRATVFEASPKSAQACPIETVTTEILPQHTQSVTYTTQPSVRPDLSQARIVVSVGRGIQSQTHLPLIEALTDALGAALGASRAVVDAGFLSNDHQVGQTGKVVAPDLYIAVGISGAIQHIAGIKDAKVIVAINKDPDAPIFQVADYGLVGDLFTLVPDLTKIILALK